MEKCGGVKRHEKKLAGVIKGFRRSEEEFGGIRSSVLE